MAIFKCKMCGGTLEINNNETVVTCEYCGTKQTVPKAMDENLQNLFNRANTLRIKSEFDKAEKFYEKIIQADTTQSEAYWGLILCKYGIEYVDDPDTYKKIPTCHRASFESIQNVTIATTLKVLAGIVAATFYLGTIAFAVALLLSPILVWTAPEFASQGTVEKIFETIFFVNIGVYLLKELCSKDK